MICGPSVVALDLPATIRAVLLCQLEEKFVLVSAPELSNCFKGGHIKSVRVLILYMRELANHFRSEKRCMGNNYFTSLLNNSNYLQLFSTAHFVTANLRFMGKICSKVNVNLS